MCKMDQIMNSQLMMILISYQLYDRNVLDIIILFTIQGYTTTHEGHHLWKGDNDNTPTSKACL